MNISFLFRLDLKNKQEKKNPSIRTKGRCWRIGMALLQTLGDCCFIPSSEEEANADEDDLYSDVAQPSGDTEMVHSCWVLFA